MAGLLQGPTQSGDTLDVQSQGPLTKLFSDPNFISLLAGVGQRLDPQGVGGALGGATLDYQKAKAGQEAAKALVARNAPPTQSPLTPAGVPGATTRITTKNADGTYSTTEKGDGPITSTPLQLTPEGAPGDTSSTTTENADGTYTKTEKGNSQLPSTSTTTTTPTTTSKLYDSTNISKLPFTLAPSQGNLDFRGLSAEQIPQILEAYHRGEQLRQGNVGQILAAYKQEEEAGKTGSDDLATAQAKTVDVLRPGAYEAQAAAAALNRSAAGGGAARTALDQYKLEQEKELGDLPRQLMQEQVNRFKDVRGTYTDYLLPNGQTVKATATEISQIETAKANASLATQQAEHYRLLNPGADSAQNAAIGLAQHKLEKEKSLGDLPRQLLEAQVTRERDASGRFLQYTMPNGQVVKATVGEAMQMETSKGAAASAASNEQNRRNHQAIQVKRWENQDAQTLLNNTTKNEAAIQGTNKDTKKPQAEDPRVIANIDEYNASSNKDYIYHWTPVVTHGLYKNTGGATKLAIPLINYEGQVRQLSAREVAAIAASKNPPMSPKDYIEKELSKWAVKK